MSDFSLKTLTRDSFVVEFDGQKYKIDGERYGDGTWAIFPKMVYRADARGNLTLVKDEALRKKLVSELRRNWPSHEFPWTLLQDDDA